MTNPPSHFGPIWRTIPKFRMIVFVITFLDFSPVCSPKLWGFPHSLGFLPTFFNFSSHPEFLPIPWGLSPHPGYNLRVTLSVCRVSCVCCAIKCFFVKPFHWPSDHKISSRASHCSLLPPRLPPSWEKWKLRNYETWKHGGLVPQKVRNPTNFYFWNTPKIIFWQLLLKWHLNKKKVRIY